MRFVVDGGVVIFVVDSFVVDSFVVGLVVIFVVGSFVVGFVVTFVVGFGVVGQFFSSDPSSQSLNPSQTVLEGNIDLGACIISRAAREYSTLLRQNIEFSS